MGEPSRSGKCTNLHGELVSPAGRIFLQRELEVSIDCFVTFQNPVDVAAVKAALTSSLIKSSPRLRSVLVTDGDGRLRWKELSYIDVNNHVIIVPEKEGEVEEMHAGSPGDNGKERENDFYINKYLAALPSLAPLSRNIPLWEVHVLRRRRKSLVLRFHHALGDCVCLLGSLLSICDPADEEAPIHMKARARPSPTMASINSRFHRSISLLLSNIVGPSEPITFANNLVTKMGVTLSSLPAALDVHMISYNGKAFLQVLVAEEIIPDPEMLCTCVARALSEMRAKI